MKKVVRITESDFRRIVKKVLFEQNTNTISQACKTVYERNLNYAKTWWKNRVSNENFMAKILYNKYNKKLTNSEWNKKYGSMTPLEKKESDYYSKLVAKTTFDIMRRLDEVKLSYYSENDGADANVEFFNRKIINVNCFNGVKDEERAKTVLIHELQHCLDEFLGVNVLMPAANGKIVQDFDTRPIKKIELEYPKEEQKKNIDFDRKPLPNEFFEKDFLRRTPEYKNIKYNCRATEVASRMAELRHYLKLGVSDDVNVNHIIFDKKAYDIILLNLVCWASRNDNVSLSDYISNLNLLAKNKNLTGTKTYNV